MVATLDSKVFFALQAISAINEVLTSVKLSLSYSVAGSVIVINQLASGNPVQIYSGSFDEVLAYIDRYYGHHLKSMMIYELEDPGMNDHFMALMV